MVIGICRFQPFPSRQRATLLEDYVVGLSFQYDEAFIDTLKEILNDHRSEARDDKRRIRSAGGWLHEYKRWFVESSVWSKVKADLGQEYPDITYVVVPPPPMRRTA